MRGNRRLLTKAAGLALAQHRTRRGENELSTLERGFAAERLFMMLRANVIVCHPCPTPRRKATDFIGSGQHHAAHRQITATNTHAQLQARLLACRSLRSPLTCRRNVRGFCPIPCGLPTFVKMTSLPDLMRSVAAR